MVQLLHLLVFTKTLMVFDQRKSEPLKLNFLQDRKIHLLEFRQDRPYPNESYEVNEVLIIFLFYLMVLLLCANEIGKKQM